jgi:uncharacterized protein YtpQ (UPF0354 family)
MMKRLRALLRGKPPIRVDPRELFAAEAAAYLRSLPQVTAVARGPDVFALDVATSTRGSLRVKLDSAFAETRDMSPEQRRARIAFFFSSAAAAEEDEPWEVARETFVPVLRSATYGIESTIELQASFVRRPFLPYLDVVVAMDRESSMSFVSRGTRERWEVDERDVFDAVEARIGMLAEPSVELYDETHGPLWIVTSNDSYESSRLLVPGWLASFRDKVDGEPIAIVPERSTLMIGGDARADMVKRLVDEAEREFGASTRRLSPALYTVDHAGEVVPYARRDDDALATKVKLGHEKLAIYEHAQQKDALDKLHEQDGTDVFVATYLVFENASDAASRSVSIWTKGVRSYLPRTEKVMLVVPSDDAGATKPKLSLEVPFEAVEAWLARVPGLHPARFETPAEFPGEEELRHALSNVPHVRSPRAG